MGKTWESLLTEPVQFQTQSLDFLGLGPGEVNEATAQGDALHAVGGRLLGHRGPR
eukprot:CAMPEP_0113944472 /NCGR_PEP_ID=MMETSP1339-20121228/34444_1 /TAXON_ID=94617 /ORGANISM="Fibrocapsa japonica" /LENGTH=54 /DNA_ID=CAMNT_0000949687 /DNA_START=433 /DNA_END=594 /DNA_ORIENTATION=- /assembly_acc=CAM_ASM_000762